MKTFLTTLIIILSIANNYAQPIEPLIESLEGILEKQKIPGAMLTIVKKDTVLNTKEDIEAGNDLVMERAFQYLFDEYGIE